MKTLILLACAMVLLTGCARYDPARARAELNRGINACEDRIGKDLQTAVAMALCLNDASRRAYTTAHFPDMDLAEGLFTERLRLAQAWDAKAIDTAEFRRLSRRVQDQYALDVQARAEKRQRDAEAARAIAEGMLIGQAIGRSFQPVYTPPPFIMCTTTGGGLGGMTTTLCH